MSNEKMSADEMLDVIRRVSTHLKTLPSIGDELAANALDDVSVAVAALIAERDALRETVGLFADDAQRYHWLRSRNELTAGVDPRGPWVTCDDETCSQYPVGAEIDAAIDAARANEST